MRGWLSKAKAIALGQTHGEQAVETVMRYQGLEVLAETLAHGRTWWNDAAQTAVVAQAAGIPLRHRNTYYEAYAAAAHAHAKWTVEKYGEPGTPVYEMVREHDRQRLAE